MGSPSAPCRSCRSGGSCSPGEDGLRVSSSYASPPGGGGADARGSPAGPDTEPQLGELPPWERRPERARGPAAAAPLELGASPTPSLSPSSGGGDGGGRALRRRILSPGQARTPGSQQRQERLPSPSRTERTTPWTPEAPGHAEVESASASASAARAALRSKRTADDLSRVAAVLATILRRGTVADHGRESSCRRPHSSLLGKLRGARARLVGRLFDEAELAAAGRAAGDKDALCSLCERMMAVIEEELQARRQKHADWCCCLLLPPRRVWAGDGSQRSDVAAKRLLEPSPGGTQAWRIKLTGSMVTLPSVMALFVARPAAAWAEVGADGSAMAFHKLQDTCAYNSCLCLNPCHVDVWEFGLGTIENARRRKLDAAARKKAADEGKETGLAADIENKKGEFPPTKAEKKRKRCSFEG